MTAAPKSPAEESLSSGFAEGGQRLLPAHLRFRQNRLEACIAPQRIERPTGRESRSRKVRLGEGSLKIRAIPIAITIINMLLAVSSQHLV